MFVVHCSQFNVHSSLPRRAPVHLLVLHEALVAARPEAARVRVDYVGQENLAGACAYAELDLHIHQRAIYSAKYCSIQQKQLEFIAVQ